MLTDLDWSALKGGSYALKYAKRDLPALDRTVARARNHRVAVQAGGNLGAYPKRLSQSFETVYAFEPSAELFPIMLENAPEPNIVRFQAALGYHRGQVGTSRERRDGKTNNHEGITHISGAGPIPTLRLDDLQLAICDAIFLDVEGWELYALQGAVATIGRCRPLLMIEINKSAAFVGIKEDDVRRFIVDLGYRFIERLHADEVYEPMEWAAC